MKLSGKSASCTASGLILIAGLEWVAASSADNPYQAIVGRNSFALKPPAVLTTTPEAPKAASPKLSLQGICALLGRSQVLVKVAQPARPPEPAREFNYVLGEGEREGDVEVLGIDVTTGTVTIKNQGVLLTLTMDRDAEKPTVGAAPSVTGVPSIPPPQANSIKPPMGIPSATPFTTIGSGGTSGTGINTMPTRSLRTTPSSNRGAGAQAPAAKPMSLEEAEIMSAVNHKIAADTGDSTTGLFPPTRLNPNLNVSPPPPPP
jgi:hypothetical protein